jgi:hypothetical protein
MVFINDFISYTITSNMSIYSLLWLLVGTVFYAVHDEFGWTVGLYQSVNIGWSIGWRMPFTPEQYTGFGSKLFSLFHNTIGVMFSGIAVIYIAAELSANKDTWLTQMVKEEALEEAANTEGYWDDILAFFTLYFHKFKVVLFLFLIGIVGVLATRLFVPEYDIWMALEFIFSTLTGAGYMTIPDEEAKYKFVLCAIYAAFGIPLLIISMGLVMSYLFTNPDEDAVYDKIIASLTPDEIDFMKMFEIDDGNGTLDIKEFIILTAVRIGSVSPDLITTIAERFKELDRDHQKSIAYADIVSGYTEIKRQARVTPLGVEVGSMMTTSAGSYCRGKGSGRVAPDSTTDVPTSDTSSWRNTPSGGSTPFHKVSTVSNESKAHEAMEIEDLEDLETGTGRRSISSSDSADKEDDVRCPVGLPINSSVGGDTGEKVEVEEAGLARSSQRRAAGDRVNAKTLAHIQKVKKVIISPFQCVLEFVLLCDIACVCSL